MANKKMQLSVAVGGGRWALGGDWCILTNLKDTGKAKSKRKSTLKKASQKKGREIKWRERVMGVLSVWRNVHFSFPFPPSLLTDFHRFFRLFRRFRSFFCVCFYFFFFLCSLCSGLEAETEVPRLEMAAPSGPQLC